MIGKLYGVGIGPGDPELLTLKAVRIIQESDVITVPAKEKEISVAYKITKQAIKDLEDKECIPLPMPMTKNKVELQKSHEMAAEKVVSLLKQGKKVAFLTLGDPTIYSTYIYIHKRVVGMGYQAEIISGIPSFCAVSARLNMGLVEKAEPLHIIPASYPIEEALELSGTKVFMKAGKKIGKVKDLLLKSDEKAVMIENCGMDNEKIYNSIDEIKENSGYYSLIIIKEKEK